MRRTLLTVALRLVLCSAVTYLLWRVLGAVGIVACAPLFGIALARPILDLLGGSPRLARQLAFRAVEGRHFEHRGRALDIVEDKAHYRWLLLSHVRRFVPDLPSDPSLRHRFPEGVWTSAAGRDSRIQAEALFDCLQGCSDADLLKFRHWLERDVIFPAQQLRRRTNPDKHP